MYIIVVDEEYRIVVDRRMNVFRVERYSWRGDFQKWMDQGYEGDLHGALSVVYEKLVIFHMCFPGWYKKRITFLMKDAKKRVQSKLHLSNEWEYEYILPSDCKLIKRMTKIILTRK